MLKAAVINPTGKQYGVDFSTPSHDAGRTSMTFYLPCASYEHAKRVADAYNGVAFTEERKGAGALNHHGEAVHRVRLHTRAHAAVTLALCYLDRAAELAGHRRTHFLRCARDQWRVAVHLTGG